MLAGSNQFTPTLSMCKPKIIYVTERARIQGDAHTYLEKLLSGYPDALLIREKDLSTDDLIAFAAPLVPVAKRYNVPLILRGSAEVAQRLGIHRLQLSYKEATEAPLPQGFESVGVSVHSLEEALGAARIGASYITYGHIFTSTCKPGLPPRGLAALDDIVANCPIPVYAIGGINLETLPFLLPSKPNGVCLMNASMTDSEPQTLTTRLRSICNKSL